MAGYLTAKAHRIGTGGGVPFDLGAGFSRSRQHPRQGDGCIVAGNVEHGMGPGGEVAVSAQLDQECPLGVDTPPAITHPEFFYGFVGVAIAFQIVFLIISRDPLKYRLMIVPSVVEKFSFGIAVAILFALDRVGAQMFAAAMIDSVLGVLFVASWFKTRG